MREKMIKIADRVEKRSLEWRDRARGAHENGCVESGQMASCIEVALRIVASEIKEELKADEYPVA